MIMRSSRLLCLGAILLLAFCADNPENELLMQQVSLVGTVQHDGEVYVYRYRLSAGNLGRVMIQPVNSLDVRQANGTVISHGAGRVIIDTGNGQSQEIWLKSDRPPCAAKAGQSSERLSHRVPAPCPTPFEAPSASR